MRQVIVLERTAVSPKIAYRIAFWLPVASARQFIFANPGKTSQVKDISQSELTSLRAGEFVEVVDERDVPPGSSLAQVQSALESIWNAMHTEFDNRTTWDRYGSNWNGTSWTMLGPF